MSSIRSIATALPPYRMTQSRAVEIARQVHAGREDLLKLMRVFTASGVEERHLAFPPGYYAESRSFEDRNRDYVEQALILSEKAAKACLQKAGVHPKDVDHLQLV